MFNLGNRIINNWIYQTSNGWVLIDTGYENNYKTFINKLDRNNIDLNDIKYIFLTHAHDDHSGFLNDILKNNSHIKIIMSEKALNRLYYGQNSFEGCCTGYKAFLFCQFMKILGKGSHCFPPLKSCYKNRCILISESNRAEIGKILNGTIIETSGHTIDSISLLLNDGILFCGDAAMNGFPSTHKITIWIENLNDFKETWEKIISIKPKKIYPGHGKPFNYEKLERNITYIEKTKLLSLSKGNK